MNDAGPAAGTSAVPPPMFQQDGTSAHATLSTPGTQFQLHRPSLSASGLSQQGGLLPTITSAGCTPVPAGFAQAVAAYQSDEGVGETGLLHYQPAATAHTSSASSSCETMTVLLCIASKLSAVLGQMPGQQSAHTHMHTQIFNAYRCRLLSFA